MKEVNVILSTISSKSETQNKYSGAALLNSLYASTMFKIYLLNQVPKSSARCGSRTHLNTGLEAAA